MFVPLYVLGSYLDPTLFRHPVDTLRAGTTVAVTTVSATLKSAVAVATTSAGRT